MEDEKACYGIKPKCPNLGLDGDSEGRTVGRLRAPETPAK